MTSEDNKKHCFTNITIYKSIVKEAYLTMTQSIETGRRPNSNGGWIIEYDPTHLSFKQAMIVIIFVGVWLEALLHILIVNKFGKDEFIAYDRKSYERKLTRLGFSDQKVISCVEKFRESRRVLVHEKAYFDSDIRIAQDESQNAYEVFCIIGKFFKK